MRRDTHRASEPAAPEPSLAAIPPVSRAQAWFTLIALVATLLFSILDRQILYLVAAPLTRSLGLSNSQLGLIQGLGAALFTVLASYPVAWLADRFDRRLVLAGCVVVWALGTAACGLAGGFLGLFIAVVAVNAGEAGAAPIILSVVPDLFSGEERVTANLVYFVGATLSAGLAMLLGGGAVMLLDTARHWLPEAVRGMETWRLSFFLVAIPAPLFLALVAAMRLPRRRTADAGAARRQQPLMPYLKQHPGSLGLVIGAIAIFAVAFAGLLAWTPVSLARIFGSTPAEIGAGMAAAAVVGGLGGVAAAGLLVRRFRPRLGRRTAIRLCWASMLVAAPSVLLTPFITAPWQAYVLAGVQQGFGTLSASLLPYILQSLAPAELRARIISLYAIVSLPLAGLSVSLSAAVSDLLGAGPRSLFWGVAIVSLPGWLAGAALMRLAEAPFERTAREVERLETDPPASKDLPDGE